MNYRDYKDTGNNQYMMLKYFDKRVPEEDNPINTSEDVQQMYEDIDALFEGFFDDNSLHLAKVVYIIIFSNPRKKKEIKKV
jgi:hypothetical protein